MSEISADRAAPASKSSGTPVLSIVATVAAALSAISSVRSCQISESAERRAATSEVAAATSEVAAAASELAAEKAEERLETVISACQPTSSDPRPDGVELNYTLYAWTPPVRDVPGEAGQELDSRTLRPLADDDAARRRRDSRVVLERMFQEWGGGWQRHRVVGEYMPADPPPLREFGELYRVSIGCLNRESAMEARRKVVEIIEGPGFAEHMAYVDVTAFGGFQASDAASGSPPQ